MAVVESRSRRPDVLVPIRLRIPVWCLVGVCVLALVILAVHYHRVGVPGRFDLAVEKWLRTSLSDNAFVRYAADLGNWPPILVIILLVTCFGYFVGRWKMMLLAVLGPMAAIAVTESVKPLIGRTINSYFALPSGHATAVISLLTTACVLSLHPRSRGIAVVGALMQLVLTFGFVAMAAGLVRDHLHYATDIIAGVCVGISVVLLLALVLDRFTRLQS